MKKKKYILYHHLFKKAIDLLWCSCAADRFQQYLGKA